MQLLTVGLALLLAHLIGDFVLQPDRVALGKRQRAFAAFAEHAAVHVILLELALLAFVPTALSLLRTHAVVFGLVVSQTVLDAIKSRLAPRETSPYRRIGFALDQLLHLVFVLGAAALIAETPVPFAVIGEWLQRRANRLLVLAIAYCTTVFAAGYANAALLGPLAARLKTKDDADASGLASAGLYVGWLERFLVLTAVLVGSAEAAGLVAAAKSVFRFGEIKEGRAFAEYFLIGTFLSVCEAVGIGLVASHLLRHLMVP